MMIFSVAIVVTTEDSLAAFEADRSTFRRLELDAGGLLGRCRGLMAKIDKIVKTRYIIK